MSSTGRPRGRPKRADRIVPSASTSRSASRKRPNGKQAPSITAASVNASGTSTFIDDDDDDDDIFDLAARAKKMPASKTSSRLSLSSLASVNDLESSGYSTPATSAAPTPALESKPSTARRGRRTAITATEPTPSVDAVKRAALLRRSRLSLNASNKRKRDTSSDEEDPGEDNTADAQLARALQEQEDAAADAMNSSGFESSLRRTPRVLQKLLPKTDYVSDYEDESYDLPATKGSYGLSKKPKIELGSKGSNGVRFAGKQLKSSIADTEDGSEVYLELSETGDSGGDFSEAQSDSDVPIVTTKANRKRTLANLIKSLPPKAATSRRSVKQTMSAKEKGKSILKVPTPVPKTSITDSEADSEADAFTDSDLDSIDDSDELEESDIPLAAADNPHTITSRRRAARRLNRIPGEGGQARRARLERARLEEHHPELNTMWETLENLPKIGNEKIEQPSSINRELKPFQLEGVAWMKAMEKTSWGGGLLGDEMGMGKTIQAVTLIMSDFPNPKPSLVLIPPVALMQWQQEIADYTNGQLKTFVFHGTNTKTKNITVKDLKQYNVILMSYNSLESMYRKQEKGFKRKDGIYKEKSVIHQIQFHRVILDEAHNIKQRTSGSAKACFALKADHKWCLSGTPLQNRIGEFFSLVRFLNIRPFSCYYCKQCPCAAINWNMNDDNRCTGCGHGGMQHVSVFNQELLNPIQKYGNKGPGKDAFRKLRILTDRFMLRRVKRDHSSAMELPAKEIYVDRQFFGEEENDFASSIMNNSNRKFETYVAQGVMLNNYANIFGLIMQMRQVADHPDLILKKNGDGGQNILVCCICDDTAEEAIRSSCRHDFCRECAKNYLKSSESPDCPQCHISLSIDLEQPEIEQDEQMVKKSSIINRIKMENWTSSSKIEALVHDLYHLRSKNMSSKSIIFSQFTTMLQLVEWRLRRAGITTVMLDGSMTPAQRQASINKFMTDVNVECFLVSLKAGGVALNLTEASKVFIVDPWWNPAAEWQSADRCHRIGQARPCSITRLCIEDSVESRMVLLQEKKANMINSTINADESAMESLTPEDMQFLFRGS